MTAMMRVTPTEYKNEESILSDAVKSFYQVNNAYFFKLVDGDHLLHRDFKFGQVNFKDTVCE